MNQIGSSLGADSPNFKVKGDSPKPAPPQPASTFSWQFGKWAGDVCSGISRPFTEWAARHRLAPGQAVNVALFAAAALADPQAQLRAMGALPPEPVADPPHNSVPSWQPAAVAMLRKLTPAARASILSLGLRQLCPGVGPEGLRDVADRLGEGLEGLSAEALERLTITSIEERLKMDGPDAEADPAEAGETVPQTTPDTIRSIVEGQADEGRELLVRIVEYFDSLDVADQRVLARVAEALWERACAHAGDNR